MKKQISVGIILTMIVLTGCSFGTKEENIDEVSLQTETTELTESEIENDASETKVDTEAEEETQSVNQKRKVPQPDTTGSDLIYTDKQLGISFKYPAEFAEIKTGVEPSHIKLFADNGSLTGTFLGAYNDGEPVGRGGYWGDKSMLINSQDYINSFCSSNETKECSVKTNANGVKYVKSYEEYFSFGPSVFTYFYRIYNPNNEFRGIILSTERFQDIMGLEAADQMMEEIVNSIKFL